MNSIYDVLVALESTKSRNAKSEILENLSKPLAEQFKYISYLAYDPSINFYIKEFDEIQDPLFGTNDGCVALQETLFDLENIIAKRVITGGRAKQWIEETYTLLSTENAEVFKRVIKGDLKIGMGPKSINKIFPDNIYIHPYMRCSDFTEKNLKNISFPCYSQTKMDALYCDIMVFEDKVEYRSRNGLFLDVALESFDKQLIQECPNSVIMCEAVALDEDGNIMERSASNGYLNSNDIDPNRVVFYTWDIVSIEEFQKEKSDDDYQYRFGKLLVGTVLKLNSDRLRIVNTEICYNVDDLINHFSNELAKGEEGTVIKDYSGIWKDGTSKHQIKLKVTVDVELEAVSCKEGTGRNEGVLGSIQFKSSDGLVEVSAGSGYTDKQRKEIYENFDSMYKGTIATVRVNSTCKSESRQDVLSLFLPRFIEWRMDKNEADTKDRIVEQTKSSIEVLNCIK